MILFENSGFYNLKSVISRGEKMKFQTKAIHAGQKPEARTGAVVTPIVTTTTFAVREPGQPAEYEYSRVSSPTRKTLENCFAELEGGKFALALASGCSAMHLVSQLLKPGDLILAEEDLYGGSLRLLKHLEKAQNLKVKTTDFSNPRLMEKSLDDKPKMIWIESPTNPLLKIIDIKAVAHKKSPDSLLVVDNTFASPYFQKPLELGADIVVHSATKYIGGHSDCLAGLIVFKREDLKELFSFFNKTLGPVLSPFDSYLLLRSLKTLSIRMERHEKNAFKLADFLSSQKDVERVLYPGLPNHPGHDVAKKQMSGFSGMLSFFIKGNQERAVKFLKNLKIFTLAESLGAVESLAEHPLTMTHGSHGSEAIGENLIRLSVGIEHFEDLIKDLKQSFKNL